MNVFKLEDGVLGLSPQQGNTILSAPAESSNLSPVSSADLSSYENTSDFGLSFFETSTKKEEYEERPPCLYSADQLDSLPIYADTKQEFPPPPNYPGPNQQQVVSASDSSCSPNSTVNLIYDQKPIISSPAQPSYTTKQNYVKPDQSYTAVAADSNSAPSSKSFIPCKVCGDKASGYHYGVTSCEGCKGFFRRSIQKQIEYRCLRDGKCLVIRLNRNRCQYCRFKKCLAVGMSRDSVRYGRVPKRSRDKHNDEIKEGITPVGDMSAARELETKQLAIYDIILTISQAHHANCAYTEERTRGLLKKLAVFSLNDMNQPDGAPDSSSVDSMEQQKIVMWQHFANFVTPAIKGVVEFAKRVPIFSDLTQDDQLILIKAGFMEIFYVQVSRMFNPMDTTLMFHDGSYITRQQLELMFDHEYVVTLLNLMSTLNNLQLNDTEIGLLSAIILLMSDRPGIYDQKAIEQQQDKLGEALKMQVARNHPSDAHLFSNIMIKIPELRSLGNKHAAHLQWFKSNWIKLTLPPLFSEIFDIPKTEDDEVFQ